MKNEFGLLAELKLIRIGLKNGGSRSDAIRQLDAAIAKVQGWKYRLLTAEKPSE